MKDREFSILDAEGQEVKLIFKRPSQAQISLADFTYRKSFSEAVRNGIVTSAEINKILKEQNVWTDDHEDKARELRGRLFESENRFSNNELTLEDGLSARTDIKVLRKELAELTSIYTSVIDNTAESYAQDIKTRFLAVECSLYADGNRKVFKDIASFNERFGDSTTLACYRRAMVTAMEISMGISLPDNVDAEAAEDKWLSQQGNIARTDQEKPKKRGRKVKVLPT